MGKAVHILSNRREGVADCEKCGPDTKTFIDSVGTQRCREGRRSLQKAVNALRRSDPVLHKKEKLMRRIQHCVDKYNITPHEKGLIEKFERSHEIYNKLLGKGKG